MNLHTTLKAYNEAEVSTEQNLIINEANAIIQQSAVNDLKTLEALGMDKNLRVFEKIQRENEQASEFDEIYDISVIKKMAIHYGLRFLPSNLYVGTIDPLLPTILNKFVAAHKIKMKEAQVNHDWRGEIVKENTQFFILAPASSFALQQRPKDPIIFYKISANKYAFIHKWGNDLSIFRKIKYWPVRNMLNFSVFAFLILSVILASVYYTTKEPFAFIFYSLMLLLVMLIGEDWTQADVWNSRFER